MSSPYEPPMDFTGSGQIPPPPPRTQSGIGGSGVGAPPPPDSMPIGELRSASETQKTMTEKYRAIQRDQFAAVTGGAAGGEDRYGNPIPPPPPPPPPQAYYHDRNGNLVPIPPGQQQNNLPPPGSGYNNVNQGAYNNQGGYGPGPGAPPPPLSVGDPYSQDPFGNNGTAQTAPGGRRGQIPMSPAQCFFGPIFPSVCGSAVMCQVNRFTQRSPSGVMPPFDMKRFQLQAIGMCGFFWLKCPLKIVRGYNTPMDSLIAGGTIGALGVNNSILRPLFIGPTEMNRLMGMYKFLRPAHFGFITYGGACMIVDFLMPGMP